MSARAKAILPLGIVIGVLSFLWCEFALNFTFHWAADGELAPGLGAPGNFHFVVWAAFISWGLFFAAGGDNAAATKIIIASIFGSVAAVITFWLSPAIADAPDFWGISLVVGIMALILVAVLIAGDWYYVAGTFPAFAANFAFWQVEGLDNWIGGLGEGVEGSTPYGWVFVSILATLIAGVILGFLSAKITAAVTPKPAAAEG